ncbi:MAG: glycosyltransferase [Bacteroides sp.]|nr:glycosyltransferase [Bacteroides sp.]MCM1085100.1 glycosyltransferase [Bacteroides sp.]
MKILIVCDGFPPDFAPRMGYLSKYLARMGCETDVVCEQFANNQGFDFLADTASKIKRIRFYRSLDMPKPRIEWATLMLRDMLFHYRDKKIISEIQKDRSFYGYDLVLGCTYRTFPLMAAEKLTEYFKVPLVVDLRDIVEQYPSKAYFTHRLPFERLFTARLVRGRNRILEKAAAVISVSEWHREVLRQFNPNSHLIYNGYDPELFFPAHQPDSCFRITFTGRMLHSKIRNPDWLFEAVARLREKGLISDTDFRLCWYVDPEGKRPLQEMATRYGIESISECHDFIPADKVPALLNRSSILFQMANKADAEGPKGIMTTKIFEALAVGKPLLLVRSDESYLEELINRYHCGLAARNVESIEEFILAQYNKWKKTGSTAIPVNPEIEQRFSRKGQAEQFLQLFKSILKHD